MGRSRPRLRGGMQGCADVDVECRKDGESFGRGRKEKMRFPDFLQRLQAGDQSLYLTTQSVWPCSCLGYSLSTDMDRALA